MFGFKKLKKKLVVAMVGLPARGKKHISHKIYRYLSWLGYNCQIFCVSDLLRKSESEISIDFDNGNNNDNQEILHNKFRLNAINDLIEFLQKDGEIAIFNATNHKLSQRQQITDMVQDKIQGCQMFWVETICDRIDVLQDNVRATKLNHPRYQGMNFEEVFKDFSDKVEKIRINYEPFDAEKGISYITVADIGDHIFINNLNGYLQAKIVTFLMNLHIQPRPIYFCRSGECIFAQENKLGGDSDLTQKGLRMAYNLADFFTQEFNGVDDENIKNIKVLTSTMKRATVTAEVISKYLGVSYMSLKTLDELDYGICDGLSLKQISKTYGDQIQERNRDKLIFRFPRGESYIDVINRIEPIIFEIERFRQPVIVVAHQAILKCLYAYFHLNDIKDVPDLDIPQNVVIKLIPGAYQCIETRITINEPNNKDTQQKLI